MNDHGLAPLEFECVVESHGQVRDSLGRDGDVFRGEA